MSDAKGLAAFDMTPLEVVEALDRHIIGQHKAKRAVAVALRNHLRRRRLPEELQAEVSPKNILMIGATGVGKTEIARRLAKLARAPFLKVEATKFTEVGYVGRDVESMIRDLVDIAIDMIREEEIYRVEEEAERLVMEQILDALLPSSDTDEEREESIRSTREKLRAKLEKGELEERYIEITVEEAVTPQLEVFSQDGIDQVGIDMGNVLSGLLPTSRKKRRMRIREARGYLFEQVVDTLINMEEVRQAGLQLAEEMGSSSSTSSTRSPPADARRPAGPASPAKGCSATSSRFSKGRRSGRATARSARRTSCSSRPARSTCRNRPI